MVQRYAFFLNSPNISQNICLSTLLFLRTYLSIQPRGVRKRTFFSFPSRQSLKRYWGALVGQRQHHEESLALNACRFYDIWASLTKALDIFLFHTTNVLYVIECKVNANERNENLLSNCRVQLCLCKGNAFYLNEETFGEVFCSKLENGLIWTMSFAFKKCKSHRVYSDIMPHLQ